MSEDIRHRLIDGCSQIIDNDQNIEVDTGYIIENLLLFDRYILSSIRLKELPALVKLFGIKGLDHLFNTEESIGINRVKSLFLTVNQTICQQ